MIFFIGAPLFPVHCESDPTLTLLFVLNLDNWTSNTVSFHWTMLFEAVSVGGDERRQRVGRSQYSIPALTYTVGPLAAAAAAATLTTIKTETLSFEAIVVLGRCSTANRLPLSLHHSER